LDISGEKKNPYSRKQYFFCIKLRTQILQNLKKLCRNWSCDNLVSQSRNGMASPNAKDYSNSKGFM